MISTDDAEAFLSPLVRMRIDDLLSDFYGGDIDEDAISEIGRGLAEALESEGSLLKEVMWVVRRHGLGRFDRGVANQLAAEAIAFACGWSGLGNG
jgi:hypothetical protein